MNLSDLLPILAALAEAGKPLDISIVVGGIRLRLSVEHGGGIAADAADAADNTAPSGQPNPSWTWLSPLTTRVVRLMCGADWLPREEIAGRLREQPDGKLAWMLTDLAERRILDSSTRKGYHLSLPEADDPEAYRAKLLLWLEAQKGA